MSTYFLSAERNTTPRPPAGPREILPTLSLESLDGNARIPLDQSTGWKALAGATGLDMPPIDAVTASSPGVAGSTLMDVRVGERPVFIPIRVRAADRRFATHQAAMQELLHLVDPLRGQFRIVATSPLGSRELTVTYTGGLEGDYGVDSSGVYWRKLGITALACQPFAAARQDRTVEFRMSGSGGAFLGTHGGTDAPWPRALSSSAVIGENMRVTVASEVPVFPTLELVGPMDSFAGTVQLEDASLPPYYGGAEWSVSIPDGVPAGSVLRLVTDPRARSIRLDGQLAAGRVARGSTLRPFYPGVNVMSVSAPGGDENTRVRLSWRELYRSLW